MGDLHHEPGTMDISVQEKTFAGFVSALKWCIGAALVVLVFLAVFNA